MLPGSLHHPERQRVFVFDEDAIAGGDRISVRLTSGDFVAGELFEFLVARLEDDELGAGRKGE